MAADAHTTCDLFSPIIDIDPVLINISSPSVCLFHQNTSSKVEGHSRIPQYKKICVQKYSVPEVPGGTVPGFGELSGIIYHIQE